MSSSNVQSPSEASVSTKAEKLPPAYVCRLPAVEVSAEDSESLWSRARKVIKTLLPSTVSIFLCSLLVAIKPIAFLSGGANYAFLVLVIYALYFHAGGQTIGKHIEVTIVGILGATLGIAISALATYIGCVSNRIQGEDNSIGGRVSPGGFSFLAVKALMLTVG